MVSPENNYQTSDNTPTFTWENGANATYHRLVIDNSPDFSDGDNIYDNANIYDNTLTIENELPPDNYWWHVAAGGSGIENWSENTWRIEIIPRAWQLIETWTGTIEAPALWKLIETWTGTVSAPAAWQLIETWTGTVEVPTLLEWQLIETWTGTVQAPAEWQLAETWTGTVQATSPWRLIEAWTGVIEVPALWQHIETWTGTIRTIGWKLIETWTGTVKALVPVLPAPSLISPADGTITDDSTPTFDWSDVAEAENYDLLIDGIQVTISVSTYTLTVELPDGTYSWKVRARDAAGNVGEWSSTWTLIIKTVVMGVEVSISPGSKSGAPEETLTYEVTVKNTGSIDDTYTLSAVGAQGWSISIEPTSLILAAGATGEATLSVVVPPDASENDSMTVTVNATSMAYPSVTDSDTSSTIVKGVPVEPEDNLALLLAISALLILLLILLLAYLLRRRRSGGARRRVLRDVCLGLGAALRQKISVTR